MTLNKIIEEDLNFIISSDIDFSIFKNKTVLITGAAGMLASYMTMVFLYLNKKLNYNINIVAISRNEEAFKKRFLYFIDDKNLSFIKGDMRYIEYNILSNIPLNFVIHTASPARSDQFLYHPLEVVYPNVFATNELLKLSVKNNIEGFLFFSTGDIYGKVSSGIMKENIMGEIDPLDIRSCYGESKRMAETLCKAYSVEYKLPCKIARICHTYGPTMDIENDSRVFAEFVNNIVSRKDIIIKSDGKSKRVFCYIADATVAFFKILINGKSGEAYNVANSGECFSIIELAEILISLFPDRNMKVIKKEREEGYLENLNVNDSKNIFIDTEKLQSLNWNPKYDTKEGFKRVVDSFIGD